MCDIVISRAGANAICELLSLRKPNLLIPLPSSGSRGDQLLNAASFEAQGFSMMLLEENLTTEVLIQKVQELFKEKDNYINAMNASNQQDAIASIMNLIKEAN